VGRAQPVLPRAQQRLCGRADALEPRAPTYRRWLAAARLHARAVPLVRRLWRAARRTGIPPTRPLWLADPGARVGRRVDDEWLLGPDVLVAPVVQEGARARAVVFPSGCWQRPGGAGRVRGPARRRVTAPLGRLPWFVRCGTRPLG
jgi:alpha-glucosidase (family GH31 glycosyl hydrolase)